MATRNELADLARQEAHRPWHGAVMGLTSNLGPIAGLFPRWTPEEAEGLWCAAFVYYCCITVGYQIPPRPTPCTCSLAGCGAWEEWAKADNRIGWRANTCLPQPGDIVIFDKVFEDKPHDHMGIVLEDRGSAILTAEGNLGNLSGVVERPKDGHIRGYISLPDNFMYGGDA